ncbi:flagellar type III secretion system protein FlhB [Scandinavium sp. H11S7]|uniref:flagellar biosynthesis protein FlhB n=1 Tax=Scandinavium hiltneri TaxID=2926519 RepID=UPI002165AD06|nr:flagellar biosynthesis protein FlhB [Scandinavium hiltneri]MCS2158091.1 flagellar type III secretion system protein FlhB [Scandinavium hiltneri]
MAESSTEEKTEKPSSQKLRKAREDGQIARSKDMGLASTLLVSFIVVSNSFPLYASFIRECFVTIHQYGTHVNEPGIIAHFLKHNLLIMLKFIVTLIPIPVAAILASMVPGGFVLLPQKLIPDFGKINPISGIGRFFSAEHLVETGKMVLKALVVLLLIWLSVRNNFMAFLRLQNMSFQQAVSQGLSMYHSIMLNFVILFVFFAIVDVPLAKKMFTKKLKMTKQEVKEEHKNQEGKPEVKAKIRRLQRQMAMGQIRKVVPNADVVITNPTHFAVALKYDQDRAQAPFVVAKGTEEVALFIRQVANENDIEVVEFPRLARSVYYTTQVNQQVPFQLYRAIAHVLTYVLQLKHWRAGSQPRPQLNRYISIPKEVLKTDDDQK